MRQDPEVLFVGEIHDRPSAAATLQTALTGHLLLTTFHAGTAAEAVRRLSEMEIEPFVLRSSINAIVCQRLLRRLCVCAKSSTEPFSFRLNHQTFELDHYCLPVDCEQCSYTGYKDCIVIAESIPWNDPQLIRAVLERSDPGSIQKIAEKAGMKTMTENALDLIQRGIISPFEVIRVLGLEWDQ